MVILSFLCTCLGLIFPWGSMKFILIYIKTFLYIQDSFILQSSDEEISVIPFVSLVQLTLAAVIANLKGIKLRYIEFDINEA